MFQKIAKHRANDASNDVHRPPLVGISSASRKKLSYLSQAGSAHHPATSWTQIVRRSCTTLSAGISSASDPTSLSPPAPRQ